MTQKKILTYAGITLVIVLIIIGVISSRGKDKEIIEAKKPYFVTVSTYKDLQQNPTIHKNGKLLGEQDITISSQVAARVSELVHNIGDEVEADTIIIDMEDNSGVYSFNAQRASTALQQARINYESTMLNLGKAVTDTQLALEQATTQYNSTADNVSNSSTNLQLDRVDAELEKAEFDYQTKLQSDQQTINNFIDSTKSITSDFKILYNDVITETDKLLGISPLYRALNDNYEKKLGAANTSTKSNAEIQFRTLYTQKDYIQNLSENISQEQLVTQLQSLVSHLEDLSLLLSYLDDMLNNTNGSSSFSAASIATYQGLFAGLQTRVQATQSAIIAQSNAIQSFMATYKQQQQSIYKNIDIARQQRDLLERNLKDAETSANIGLDSAKSAVNTTLKSKDTTEAALKNAIQQAQISYNEASNQLAKLKVKSPIAGSIGQIYVDVGQEVAPGTPLFTISSNDQPQIEISIGSDELQFIEPGQKVHIIVGGKDFTGTISSIGKVAENNFTYQAIISLNQGVSLLGGLAQIDIPVQAQYPLLPINLIEIINKSSGMILYLEGGEVKQQIVELGDVRGDLIEIRSNDLDNIDIITSNIDNFDPNKYELSIK